MQELSSLYHQQAADLPKPQRREVEGFAKKLLSFVHAPLNLAAVNRLLPFSRQPAVVDLVADLLPNYKPWNQPYYDIIGYWYSLALLSLSGNKTALEALNAISAEALAVGWSGLDLLRRHYGFFAEVPELAPLRAAVEQHFQRLMPQVDALTWARQIGLQVPAEPDWQVSFQLTTDGEKKFAFQLSADEKKQRIELKVDVFGAASGDGQSWVIRFMNSENSTAGRFTSPQERQLCVHRELRQLAVAPSLLRFEETLAALEAAIGVRFVRTISFSYFSKGIKNKGAVAKWLAQATPPDHPPGL